MISGIITGCTRAEIPSPIRSAMAIMIQNGTIDEPRETFYEFFGGKELL